MGGPVRNAGARAARAAPTGGIRTTSPVYPWQRAEDAGEVVEAFHQVGGRPFFRTPTEYPNNTNDERLAGLQLCAHVYVPIGYVGFVKGVSCAPYLGDYFAAGAENQILDSIDGVWQTPMGWEAMESGEGRPAWRWHLRVLSGKLEDAQDLTTGFLVPDIPMPQAPIYGGNARLRIPGRAAGKKWSAVRMQRYGRSVVDDQVHVLVPEDHTLIVIAEWEQPVFLIGSGGELVPAYALGPSFGAIVGAMQRNARPEGQKTARQGWRG
jgi:hypothetical protein